MVRSATKRLHHKCLGVGGTLFSPVTTRDIERNCCIAAMLLSCFRDYNRDQKHVLDPCVQQQMGANNFRNKFMAPYIKILGGLGRTPSTAARSQDQEGFPNLHMNGIFAPNIDLSLVRGDQVISSPSAISASF